MIFFRKPPSLIQETDLPGNRIPPGNKIPWKEKPQLLHHIHDGYNLCWFISKWVGSNDTFSMFTTFKFMFHNLLMWQEPTQFKCAVFIWWIHRLEAQVNKHLVFCLEPNSKAGQEEEARIIEAITFSRQASQSPASQYLFWNLTFKIFLCDREMNHLIFKDQYFSTSFDTKMFSMWISSSHESLSSFDLCVTIKVIFGMWPRVQ